MRLAIIAPLLMLSATSVCIAAPPVTLKCVADNGDTAANLTVDLDKGTLVWGPVTYKITSVTDRYISAYQQPTWGIEPGGEVWMLDRATGDYWRAAVYLGGTPEEAKLGSLKPVATTFGGRCTKPVV